MPQSAHRITCMHLPDACGQRFQIAVSARRCTSSSCRAGRGEARQSRAGGAGQGGDLRGWTCRRGPGEPGSPRAGGGAPRPPAPTGAPAAAASRRGLAPSATAATAPPPAAPPADQAPRSAQRRRTRSPAPPGDQPRSLPRQTLNPKNPKPCPGKRPITGAVRLQLIGQTATTCNWQ